MTVDPAVLQQVVNKLKASQKILITPSSPADGDCLGAALSLYLVLRKLGKEPTVAMSDDIPESYDFLPRTDEIHHELSGSKDFIITLDCKDAEVDTIKYQVEEDVVNIIVTPKTGSFKKEAVNFQNGVDQYDVIVTVDAGDIHQMRDLYEENKEMFERLPVINIDHHASNSKFGDINYVDLDSSSTTQALIPVIDALNDTGSEIIDKDIATLLLTGLITDTGSFQHSNTTPAAFEVASRLLDLGAEQQKIIKKVYKTKSLSTLKLWGRVLSKIQYDEEHRLVWSTITQADLLETNSTTEESNGIIDELMTNAPGAELIILLKQKADDLVSASVRTNSDQVDGSAFAGQFGGGGHVRAAGFRVKGKDMAGAEAEVIAAAKKFQADRLNLNPSAAPKIEDAMIEAEKIEAGPKPVKSEEVVEKLTRDFVAGPTDTPAAPAVAPQPVPVAAPVVPAPAATPKTPEQQAQEVAAMVSQQPASMPAAPVAPPKPPAPAAPVPPVVPAPPSPVAPPVPPAVPTPTAPPVAGFPSTPPVPAPPAPGAVPPPPPPMPPAGGVPPVSPTPLSPPMPPAPPVPPAPPAA